MKTVVLLSAGIDSTVLLADRVHAGDTTTAVTFDYGQTHRREIRAACDIAEHYALTAAHRIIELPRIFGSSALLGDSDIPPRHADHPDTTTVPGRNLVMLTVAAAIAAQHHAAAVFIGANLDDAAGYLDCRPEFMRVIDDAVSLGTGSVSISAPYLSMSKADIIAHGHNLGAPLHLTWSCYRGGQLPCGRCGACASRETAMA